MYYQPSTLENPMSDFIFFLGLSNLIAWLANLFVGLFST